MQYVRNLTRLLRRRDFRRLFAVRLSSQLGDGVFQVALASYVLFSPERAPDAAGIAGLLAVILLPYSILGPFTGVLLDRWSRRQILYAANLTRAILVLLVAAIVAAGNVGPLFYLVVLLTLGMNRFLLSGLSASLPHVVDPDELVMANAVTPTTGTAVFIAGSGVGALVRLLTHSDLAVPRTRIADLITGCARIGAEVGLTVAVVGHAGDGNMHPTIVYDPTSESEFARAHQAFDDILAVGLSLGGTVTGEHGVGKIKREWLAREIGPIGMRVHRSIKAALDPDNLFNPGSMFAT